MANTRLRKLKDNPWIREGAFLLGLYWLYSSIRWFVARESPYEAFENAYKIIQLERQIGIFHEPNIQRWLIDEALWAIQIANSFYSLAYFPILVLTGLLLYRYSPRRFQIFKLTFMLGLGFALICFSLFPLAPPRMLSGMGFVDTQQAYGSDLYNRKFVLSFYNPYAAMPSLHFGWALLTGIMACSFDRRPLKLVGILYPCCMAFVIVITGHHYFLDIAGGGLVVGLAYFLVKTLQHLAKDLTPSAASFGTESSFGKKKIKTPYIQRPKHLNSHPENFQSPNLSTLYEIIVRRKPPL